MSLQNLSRRLLSIGLAASALLALSSCGNYSNPTATGATSSNPVSAFKTRIFLLNSFFGTIVIMNGDNDQVWGTPISVGNGANLIAESLDGTTTLVASPSTNTVSNITNSTETVTTTVALPSFTESFSVLADNKTGIAAVRNAPVTGKSSGAVLLLDLANSNISASIPVPLVRYLSLNKARTKVLAFAENSDSVWVIDTSAKTATAVPGFDRPVAAVFNSDDSTAYILNCGPECGGTTASVTRFDTSNNSLGANIPVSAATVGLIDSGKLYVAGTASNLGQLDVIDTTSNTRTQSGIAISNGYHKNMVMASGSNLYIGSQNCTNQTTGCLSIYTVGGSTALQSPTLGSVYGLQPLPSRNLVYVSIGGELSIYDTTTNAPRPSNQFDVVGFAGDVKQIN